MSKELDDAAEESSAEDCSNDPSYPEYGWIRDRMFYEKGFKAGAAWAEKHSPRVLVLAAALQYIETEFAAGDSAQLMAKATLAAWREE